VDYYLDWAKSGAAGAPKYVRIAGVGSVEQIRDKVSQQDLTKDLDLTSDASALCPACGARARS